MKIEKRDGSDEKTVLIGMIVDDRVCGRIAGKWASGLFRSKWSNLIGGWCIRHYERYSHAPGKKIQHSFERWAEKAHDDSTVNLVEKFLSGLSDEWEEMKRESNSDYVLDVAGRHFALVQIEKLKDEIEDHIADKDPEKAQEAIEGRKQIKLGLGEGVDVMQDKEAWKSAFGPHTEPLIDWGGSLGKFFNNAFARSSFVSFEGPEGRGKSYWLMETAFQAVLQRRRVAFFELGDMTRDQIMERMGVRIAKTPLEPMRLKIPRDFKYEKPSKGEDEDPQKRKALIRYDEKSFDDKLDWRMAWKACQEVCRSRIKSDQSYWKLFSHAPDMLHCRDIEQALTDLEREDWVPDCVVVDYADLLNMSYAGKEGRDCINETWKHLRKISVLHHCLVVTATQTNAQSSEAWVIRRRHFSEDKRKRAHITAGYGLNQTESEKDLQIMRLNNIKKRKGAYKESSCVSVIACLDLANCAVRSAF